MMQIVNITLKWDFSAQNETSMLLKFSEPLDFTWLDTATIIFMLYVLLESIDLM